MSIGSRPRFHLGRHQFSFPPVHCEQKRNHTSDTDNESSDQLDGQHKHPKTGSANSANSVSSLRDSGLHNFDSVDGHDTSANVHDAAAVGDGMVATGHVGGDCSVSCKGLVGAHAPQ